MSSPLLSLQRKKTHNLSPSDFHPGALPHGDTHPALHAQLAIHGSDRDATKHNSSVHHQSTRMTPSLIKTKRLHANHAQSADHM